MDTHTHTQKPLKIKNVFFKKCTTKKMTFEQGKKIKLSRERKNNILQNTCTQQSYQQYHCPWHFASPPAASKNKQ